MEGRMWLKLISLGIFNRGTRNLMRDIQSEINGKEIEETDFDSENQEEM